MNLDELYAAPEENRRFLERVASQVYEHRRYTWAAWAAHKCKPECSHA